MDNEDLFESIKEYGKILGDYFGSLTEDERKLFRGLRGIEGQTAGMRHCQKAIHDRMPSFNPPELGKFLEEEKAQTNKKAKEIVDRIEKRLNEIVLETLYREFGEGESEWWLQGVPKKVRTKVSDRFEEDDGSRGAKAFYFDLIDYRDVITNNWQLFEDTLAYGKSGNKIKRTEWIVKLNDIRKVVSHYTGKSVSIEELNQIQEYDAWLLGQCSGIDSIRYHG
jgi:hypothetical protein